MNKNELIERYRNIKLKHRLLIVALLAILYPLYDWYEQSEVLLANLEGIRLAENDSRQKNQTYKSKVTGLPALEDKLSTVRERLETAKKLLPERVEVDKLLTKVGNFEKSIGVTLISFEPKPQVRPDPNLQYAEIPIEITLKGRFGKIMTLLDELVHFEELTHLRNVTIVGIEPNGAAEAGPVKKEETTKDEGIDVTAKASLVAFKSISL